MPVQAAKSNGSRIRRAANCRVSPPFATTKPLHHPATATGGNIAGAIISVTPDLSIAAQAVAQATTLREKAEALQFLTDAQKDAFDAATAVAAQAQAVGALVVAIGGTLRLFCCVCCCYSWCCFLHAMP